jgi:hypothetical protein
LETVKRVYTLCIAFCGYDIIIPEAISMMKEVIDDYFEHVEENDFSKEDLIEMYNRGNKIITEITI